MVCVCGKERETARDSEREQKREWGRVGGGGVEMRERETERETCRSAGPYRFAQVVHEGEVHRRSAAACFACFPGTQPQIHP